jgi:predicted ATPase
MSADHRPPLATLGSADPDGADVVAAAPCNMVRVYELRGHPAAESPSAETRQGSSLLLPRLARAHAELGQFEEAWRCIGEAMTAVETTKEKWCEAEVHRVAGEIALKSPEPGAAKAQAYFERAPAVARAQQAKSWELRAATSLVRLWRDQGKPQQARELLAPIYSWFTEGFETRDLKEAKALLDELAA